MPGENYPGKLWMQVVTTALNASTFNSDGISAIEHNPDPLSPGEYVVHLEEAIDPALVLIRVSLSEAPGPTPFWQIVDNQTIKIKTYRNGASSKITSTRVDGWGPIPASGVNYCAQFPAGAAINFAGPFNAGGNPSPRRAPRIVCGAGSVATDFTVEGTAVSGPSPLQTVVTSPGGVATVELPTCFETITRFASNHDPQGTTDLQTGNGFELTGAPVVPGPGEPESLVLAVDGIEEAPASVNFPTWTIVPTTAPDGTHRYTVRLRTTQDSANTDGVLAADQLFQLQITRLAFLT